MNSIKMQGIRSDYIYMDCFKEKVEELGRTTRLVSNRHFGIGSDGLILIYPLDVADRRMETYSADDPQGIMCGNGVCCVGKYAYDHSLVPADRRRIAAGTLKGVKNLDPSILGGRAASIAVDVGEVFLTSKLPEGITADETDYRFVGIGMRNPHAVYYMEEVDSLDTEKMGSAFELHERFQPHRVNTEFIQTVDRGRLRVRVWERGSGETWACDAEVAANVMASILMGYMDGQVQVNLRDGNLQIRLGEGMGHLFMTGPAVGVFSRSIDIPREIYYD